MKRCYCPSCRARDDRTFERIIDANYSHAARTLALIRETERAIGQTVRARIGRYGMPAIPEWEGEPSELTFGKDQYDTYGG